MPEFCGNALPAGSVSDSNFRPTTADAASFTLFNRSAAPGDTLGNRRAAVGAGVATSTRSKAAVSPGAPAKRNFSPSRVMPEMKVSR